MSKRKQEKLTCTQTQFAGTLTSTIQKMNCLINRRAKLELCEKLIKNWSKRNLTFFGKIKIIKSLIMPKFVYLAQSLIVPADILKEINSLIFTFLWSGKREKIKRTTVIGLKTEGGLDMCDLNTFLYH